MNNTEQKSSKPNNIFYIVVFILLLISTGITFYKIVIKKDYQIIDKVSCDPRVEKCFKIVCDSATDDTCPVNIEEQTTYYRNISKSASSILSCENTEEKNGCKEELSCTPNELNCYYTYCDSSNLGEGEQCTE